MLVQCHECGGQVSLQATACPMCGTRVLTAVKVSREQKKRLLLSLSLLYGGLLVFLFAILRVIGTHGHSPIGRVAMFVIGGTLVIGLLGAMVTSFQIWRKLD